MKLFCKLFGHRPVSRGITLPRQWFCTTCGRRLG